MKNPHDSRHSSARDEKNNQQRTEMNLRADEQLLLHTGDEAVRAELRSAMARKEQALEDLRAQIKEDAEHQQNQLR
jgi:hypothetical protein